MPPKQSNRTSSANSSSSSVDVDAFLKKLETIHQGIEKLEKQNNTRMTKLQHAIDIMNHAQQNYKTKVSKLENILGITTQNEEQQVCANKEDEVFMVTIPKKYAIQLDKKCYHAAELWNWVRKNDTVPHTRRKLTKQEFERIKQKANASRSEASSVFESAKSSASTPYVSG